MIFEANSKLVMIGDSITDCGRAQPVGEGAGLGDGYVKFIDAWIGASMPELNLRILNVGTSGNTVRALAARWQRDVIDLAPDYLSIMIGINDVWRQFDTPLNPEQHVGPNEYEGTLRQLVSATQSKLKKLILMTPFFIEPSLEDDMRRRMDEYGSIVKRVAQEFDAILVDTQVAFDRVLRHRHSAAIAWDRVHPGHVGHMVLARAFLQSVMAPFEPLGAKRHS